MYKILSDCYVTVFCLYNRTLIIVKKKYHEKERLPHDTYDKTIKWLQYFNPSNDRIDLFKSAGRGVLVFLQ
jgi:hypothetical protein